MTRPDLTIVPPVDYDTRPNLYEGFRNPLWHASQTGLRSRITWRTVEAHFPAAMLGFFAGMMSTVGLAYLWSFFL